MTAEPSPDAEESAIGPPTGDGELSPAERAVSPDVGELRDDAPGDRSLEELETALQARHLGVAYNGDPAVKDISLTIPRYRVVAFIGPSGCGKSTLLRCFNRMNDLIAAAEVTGEVLFHGRNLNEPDIDPVEVRRRIGMVFQKPNPFPKSIYDNVAYGPRIHGLAKNKAELDDIVEKSLRRGAIWDEVKDRLQSPGTGLSGGQQQRLCIARAVATEPEVLLMDEPCSALDPIATAQVEELIDELRQSFSVVIVTHSMQQAARVSQKTAFFHLGRLVEYGETGHIFTNPTDPRTESYITGRIG